MILEKLDWNVNRRLNNRKGQYAFCLRLLTKCFEFIFFAPFFMKILIPILCQIVMLVCPIQNSSYYGRGFHMYLPTQSVCIVHVSIHFGTIGVFYNIEEGFMYNLYHSSW